MSKPKIKPIELRLILATRTEKRLRRYCKRQFKMTLEQKLMDILKEWIGKAIKNSIHVCSEILKKDQE
ncbi:hypothetical protein ES702_06726 [subsurface metagenome]